MSSSMITASECLPNASLMESCRPPRSLATCVSSWSPVQPQSTEDLRTWLQQAGPANPTARRAAGVAPMTSAKDGPSSSKHFAKLAQNGSWERTSAGFCQLTLDDTLAEYKGTWPKQGIAVRGECYRLAPLVRHTHGKGCSLWPTPTASEGLGGGTAKEAQRALNGELRASGHKVFLRGKDLFKLRYGVNPRPIFWEWLMGWVPGWTGLEPLATDRFRAWLQQHGIY